MNTECQAHLLGKLEFLKVRLESILVGARACRLWLGGGQLTVYSLSGV
jgi:hypothetical protein